MALLDKVLDPPSYGFSRDGLVYIPTKSELFREFFSRLNIFKSRKNWIQCVCWGVACVLIVPFFIFVFKYFHWWILPIGFVYSMGILGMHGTIWYHRHGTHRAFQFRNAFSRFLVANMVIKIIPEEIYIVSHHVHHRFSEGVGDPYNVNCGWLYCFLADVNHQPIAKDLSETEYKNLCRLVDHTGVRLNTYEQYQKWGSLAHPLNTILTFALNWAFWYGVFYLIGGHALAMGLFGASMFWAFGVRTFNFDGHGAGRDKRQDGIDFNRADLSINQIWPGVVTGEWHNNHHLYPGGARAGFLPYQFDSAWEFIRFYHFVGGITSYRDYKEEFFRDHYLPYLEKQKAMALPAAEIVPA